MGVLKIAQGRIRVHHGLCSPFVQEVETFGFLCLNSVEESLTVGTLGF